MNNGIAAKFGDIGHTGRGAPASHIEIRWEDGQCRARDIPRGVVRFGGCECGCIRPEGTVVAFDVEGDVPHAGPAFCMAIVRGAERATGQRFEVQAWWMTKTRKTFRAVVA